MKRLLVFVLLLSSLFLFTGCTNYKIQIDNLSFDAATNSIGYDVLNPTDNDLLCEIDFGNLGNTEFEIAAGANNTFIYQTDLPDQVLLNVRTRCKPI
jgi:hypothetical protein